MMGQQIVKQPDGRFAIYSTVVDDFIAVGLTADEVVEAEVEEAKERAVRDTRARLVRAAETGSSGYSPFAVTWEKAIDAIREHHGDARAQEHLRAALSDEER